MKTQKGNILDVEDGIICHQVNCQGKMGAGLAKGIRNRFPKVYKEYMKLYNEGGLKVGNIQVVPVDVHLSVINMMAQDKYGRHRRYTDYKAFRNCLKKIKKFMKEYGYDESRLYFPYKIGCNLAGGEWNIIESMIEKYFPNATIMKC